MPPTIAIRLIIVVVGSLVLRRLGAPAGEDVTRAEDYEVEAGAPGVRPMPGTPEQEEGAEHRPAPVRG